MRNNTAAGVYRPYGLEKTINEQIWIFTKVALNDLKIKTSRLFGCILFLSKKTITCKGWCLRNCLKITFNTDRIGSSIHITNHFQALFSGGGSNQFYNRHDINHGFPFPAFADVTKQLVLYFIPFRCPWRKMGYLYRKSCFLRQSGWLYRSNTGF